MIGYEITAEVMPELRVRYELYMRERHIPDVLATGMFAGARLSRADDGRFRIRYEFTDRAGYEKYIERHSARLRADFDAHFPEGVTQTRDVWTTLQVWPH